MRTKTVFVIIFVMLSALGNFSCKKKVQADFKIISYEKSMKNGDCILTGIIQNMGTGDGKNVSLYMEAKNSTSQYLCNGMAEAWSLMQPGDQGNFRIGFYILHDWAKVAKIDYQISWSDVEKQDLMSFWGTIHF